MDQAVEQTNEEREESPDWHDIGDEPKQPKNNILHYGHSHFWSVDGEVEDQSLWCELPDIIMEQIFSYLNISQRYNASMVCKRWNSAFYLPYVWHVFHFDDHTLTRRRFNYYSGWQHTLDHLRAQLCLGTVGRFFQHLVFTPMANFYNMYEFMNMISFYAEQQDSESCPVRGISRNIKALKYVFPCKYLSGDEEEATQEHPLYGTGGKLLDAVKRLMGNLRNLRSLELTDLMLDNSEASTLLDDVCCECCQTLRILSISNLTKRQCTLLHVGAFINLQILVIGPQNLGEDAIEMLSHTPLKHLHITQTTLTPSTAKSLSPKCWQAVARRSPNLQVHLSLETKSEKALLWQEKAPVNSICVNSPLCKVSFSFLSVRT
ncbi:FBOX [Nesidiocoris tenuis]|uniref:FBOX n=1 Tax=Nesidiocoris tenuis TaxID=355587 RepID=A0ABN7AW96_9HEMI|nr:FBOX [Nesidiocoris tenuis]